MSSELRRKVIVNGPERIRVIRIGIQGPAGATVTFNDAEGDPTIVGLAAAEDGISEYAARRDHKHTIDTAALDARYGTLSTIILFDSNGDGWKLGVTTNGNLTTTETGTTGEPNTYQVVYGEVYP